MTREIAFPQFNQATHCLGSLCQKNHDYNHMGHSMRYIKSGECVICMKLKRRRYFKTNKGKAMCNRACRTDASKKRSSDYQKTNHGKATHKKSRLKYLQTEKGKLSKRRAEHARRSTVSKVPTHIFSVEQLKEHFEKFGNVCVYCGSSSTITIDHMLSQFQREAPTNWTTLFLAANNATVLSAHPTSNRGT